MICPHCAKNLLRKERTGNTCSHCRRTYALDPKTNSLGLHDLRVRRVAAKVTAEGSIAVTADQLWYALSRSRLRKAGYTPGCAGAALGFGLFTGFFGLGFESAFVLAVAGGLLLVGAAFTVAWAVGVDRGFPAMPRAAFEPQALRHWRSRYGGLPPGIIDAARAPAGDDGASAAASPGTAVLLCPDPAVRVFLAASGLPARFGVLLADDLDAVRALPGDGPVIVLRDADAWGEFFVRDVRAALDRRRVVDAGLPVRSVVARAGAVPYRDRGSVPDRRTMARLTDSGDFTGRELKWMGRGWRFPLVALPPARLLAVFTRVAGQAARTADPEHARASGVGFMTWPGPESPGAGGPG
ncbi:hypothetical protein OG206_27490 [Streptomyces sp. NBC_01341]|uniref:hypothetical protein n=1 Tax=Streptomyces sp. NBC_01341 TaxID=2903831 RepID=UPI002E0FE0CA|nr:hypothetical protein OG206_27490 [Streptomyces sp. NBC_01341]